MRVIALASALSMLSACSFVLVPSVKTEHPEGCKTYRGAPVADLVLAAAELTLTAGLLMVTESTTCWNSNCETHEIDNTKPAMVVGTLSLVQLVSAGVGYSRTTQCRNALERQQIAGRR